MNGFGIGGTVVPGGGEDGGDEGTAVIARILRSRDVEEFIDATVRRKKSVSA